MTQQDEHLATEYDSMYEVVNVETRDLSMHMHQRTVPNFVAFRSSPFLDEAPQTFISEVESPVTRVIWLAQTLNA